MDIQSDSCEPLPCDTQPPGKIRKALKLFSKRTPGSGVASIFSVRVKGERGLKSTLSRSKTLDGLTERVGSGAATDSMDLDQEDSHKEDAALDEPTSMKNNLESTVTRQSFSSLTSAKSLSFLSMLRRNRKEGEEKREAQTESHRSSQQRKGLKSLFGSVRWYRKDKEEEDAVLPGPPLLASRSNSVEIMKEKMTLTPRSAHHATNEAEFKQQPCPSQDDHAIPEDTNKVSGAHKPNDRLSTLLGDISSILSLDSGGGDIVADVEAEWVKVSNRVEVEDGTGEVLKKEKALSHKPMLSASPTLSSTPFLLPSPTTKLISSSTSSKPMLNSTKQTPPPTPSPTTSTEPIVPSHTSPSTFSLTAKPVPSPVLSPESSPIPSQNIISAPITIPTSPPSTTSQTNLNKSAVTPTPPLTPESSPKPSSTYFPAPSTTTISESLISLTEKALEPFATFSITESAHSLNPTIKPTQTVATTLITKPIHSLAQNTKHSSVPVNKYPPFITSTKPVSTAPVIRPKIVTTFGLSTSRNTAPIMKPEPKQSAQQIKSGPFQPQNEKNGSGSVVPKVSPSEPGPSHVDKRLLEANYQPTPVTSFDMSENAPHKPEVKEDMASIRVVKDPQPALSYKSEKKTQIVKPTTLSKIPVSAEGKSKQQYKNVQTTDEEKQWNLPTPLHEEDTVISFSCESSSKDALSDLSTDSGAITPVLSYNNENKLESTACSTIGTVSITRESKIPIKTVSTTSYHTLQEKTKVARSKIPVSKVPIRRTSNKSGPTSTASATQK